MMEGFLVRGDDKWGKTISAIADILGKLRRPKSGLIH